MSVARAQAEISSAEFSEWMAHFELKGEGQQKPMARDPDQVRAMFEHYRKALNSGGRRQA